MIGVAALLQRHAELLESPASAERAARRERILWWLLALAILAYATLALFLTRGAIPYYDGMAWLLRGADGFDPSILLEPHNGHLIAVTRVLYAAGLRIFGPEQVVFQIAQIVAVSASAALLFVLLRRRIDSLLALAPSVLLLFLGSTTVLVDPNVAVFAQSTALGLGALLALDRGDRLGDAVACVLLLLGVMAFSLGVPFALGAGVAVAAGHGSARRAWIVAVPLLCYLAWVVWAQQFEGGELEFGGGGPEAGSISNLLLAPSFALDSLAAALAAATGLGRALIGAADQGLVDVGWGRVLAVALVGLVAIRGFRGRPSKTTIAVIVVLLTYWVLGAMNLSPLRLPQTERYAFPAVALCFLVLAEMLPRGMGVTRGSSIAAIALVLLALPGNLFALRTNAASIRTSSAKAKADLAVAELERANIDPDVEISPSLLKPVTAGRYLEFADRYGSLASTPDQLLAEPDAVRQWADIGLVRILGIRPVPDAGAEPSGCSTARAVGGIVELTLPEGGALLRSSGSGELDLRRFADSPYVDYSLPAGRLTELSIPLDASSQPWVASIEGARSVQVCPIPASGAT